MLGGTVAIAAQKLVISLPNKLANSGASVVSTGVYDLTGCRGFVELTQVPDTQTSALAFLELANDPQNSLLLIEISGKLQAKKRVNGAETILVQITYDPVGHAHLGISEHGGAASWDTSPDGKTWTSFWQASNPLLSPLVHLRIAAFTYQMEQIVPGEAHFDNVDLAP